MRAPGGVPRRRSQKRGYPRHIKCRHNLVEVLARPVDHSEKASPLIRGRERAPSTGHSMRRIRGVLGTSIPMIITGIVPDLVRGPDAVHGHRDTVGVYDHLRGVGASGVGA